MMNVNLIKQTPEHFELHARWRNASKGHFPPQPDWTTESQQAWYAGTYLLTPALHIFIVTADNAPVGVLGFNSATREIGPVLLGEQAMRRRGVMTKALRELYQAFAPGHYWLKVLSGNQPAIAFYGKNGFAAIKHSPVAPHDSRNWITMGRLVREADL